MLTFTAEIRSGLTGWTAVSTIDQLRLCDRDYALFTRCADTAMGGDSGVPILGLPLRGTSGSLAPNFCDSCQSELPEQAVSLEFVPLAQLLKGWSRTRREGALRRLRLCRLCLGWWRTSIAHPHHLTGTSVRKQEGPGGGWLSQSHGNAVTFALRPRDSSVVATTMAADQAQHRVAQSAIRLAAGELALVGAGKRGRAAAFVRALPLPMRRRVVVVAHLDQVADAREALLAGASELLASPLSPQQVVGAFVRGDAWPQPEKDPQSGLPIYSKAKVNRDATYLQFSVPSESPRQLLELALLARRSVRGYDVVGTDGKGEICLWLMAESANAQRITERLALVFGKQLRFLGAAA